MKNPIAQFPGYLLRRAASARMAELARRLEPFAVSVTEASILALIVANPDISQAECGRVLAIKRANLNPLVRRLVTRGLVEVVMRRGRAQGLQATAEGLAIAREIETVFETHESDMMAAVPPHLRETLVETLRALWPVDGGDGAAAD